MMGEFDAWLERLASEPLPGAVSAAAVASAMGAGLVAKACRVTLRRGRLVPAAREAVQSILDQATAQRQALIKLAEADEAAYRVLLGERPAGPLSASQIQARHRAAEVPIQVAEACRSLLGWLPDLLDCCWPAVRPELEVGAQLVGVGLRAGLLVAERNLRAWRGGSQFPALHARVQRLRQTALPRVRR